MSIRGSNSSDEAPATANAAPPPLSAAGGGPLLSFNELSDRCLTQRSGAGRTRLEPDDAERLKISFTSQAASCYVCPCLASVYQKVDKSAASVESAWQLVGQSGVLVLRMPNFIEPDQKFAQSQLLLVQLGTCLPLWSLSLHSATQYSQTHVFFQTVLDPAGKTVYGLAFLDTDAATEFSSRASARIREMADLEATSMKERRRTIKEKERRSKSLRRLLSRSKSSNGFTEISSPCIYQRVASATAQECDRVSEILGFGQQPPTKVGATEAEAEAEAEAECSIAN